MIADGFVSRCRQVGGVFVSHAQHWVAARNSAGRPSAAPSRGRSTIFCRSSRSRSSARACGSARMWWTSSRIGLVYAGSERTTRRAGRVKRDWRAGRRQVHRPWVPKPGDNVAITKRPGLSGYSRKKYTSAPSSGGSTYRCARRQVRVAAGPMSPTLEGLTGRVAPAGSSV
jgi:hypothetical protein